MRNTCFSLKMLRTVWLSLLILIPSTVAFVWIAARFGRRVLVAAGNERGYLSPWNVRVLPGVGRKVGDRLDLLNVQKIGEVAVMPLTGVGKIYKPALRELAARRPQSLDDLAAVFF